MTVDWKELLGTDDPTLQDVFDAKELAASMNARVQEGYGDDEPEPAPKRTSPPKPRDLSQEVADAQLAVENQKEVLNEAATKHGPASEHVVRAQAKLVEAQQALASARSLRDSGVIHQAEAIHSAQRARVQVMKEVEAERKEYEKQIHVVVGRDTEAFKMLAGRYDERVATPDAIERRVAERAAQLSEHIQRITDQTMPGSPIGARPDLGAPPIREVNAPVITAQEGFAQFLEKKGDPLGAAEVRAGRLPAK
jgi:hypothetical protein